ncbi:MAG: QueT transporter family protein [Oscillospiraceae bacterium]|nr:QueT transporter family protein [Oscillospiraceae bacterium]
MHMKKMTVRDLTISAVLAGVYAALTLFLPMPQYAGIQLRVAEALCVLPFFYPVATPGLFVGCVIANLFSPFVLDVVFGSAATLLACLWTGRLRSRWLAPLPPVVCNAVVVGGEIALAQGGFGAGFWAAFAFNAFNVGVGELLACGVLGSVLLSALYRREACRGLIPTERLEKIRGFSA